MPDSNLIELDAMPAEILCKVAKFLPTSGIKALRLTNKAIQEATFNAFTDDNFKEFRRPVTLQDLRKWSRTFDCESIANSVRTLEFSFRRENQQDLDDDLETLLSLLMEVLAKLPNVSAIKVFGVYHLRTISIGSNIEEPVEQFLHALAQQHYALTKIALENTNLKSSTLASLLKQYHGSLRVLRIADVVCCGGTWSNILPTLRDAPRLTNVHFHWLRDESDMTKAATWSGGRVVRAVRNPYRQIKVKSAEDPGTYRTVSAIEYYTTDRQDARIEGNEAVAKGIDAIVRYTREYLQELY